MARATVIATNHHLGLTLDARLRSAVVCSQGEFSEFNHTSTASIVSAVSTYLLFNKPSPRVEDQPCSISNGSKKSVSMRSKKSLHTERLKRLSQEQWPNPDRS